MGVDVDETLVDVETMGVEIDEAFVEIEKAAVEIDERLVEIEKAVVEMDEALVEIEKTRIEGDDALVYGPLCIAHLVTAWLCRQGLEPRRGLDDACPRHSACGDSIWRVVRSVLVGAL